MTNSNPVTTPMISINFPYRSLIGCLQYLAQCTRPDISLAVGKLARFVENPGRAHWKAAKRVLRYLKHTKEFGVQFGWNNEEDMRHLFGYVDASYADTDNGKRKSTTGFVFMFGGGAVSWTSYRQRAVARSSTEAEYMALADAGQEAAWRIRWDAFSH
jgi:hypothetical protein